jgi:hydroxymethylbilane synthase
VGDAPAAAAAARAVHHTATAVAVAAERAFLRTLEGGCQVPVAAHAALDNAGRLRLHGRVVSLGGERGVEGIETGAAADEEQADEHGIALAERLLDDGAASILAEVRAATAPVVPEP